MKFNRYLISIPWFLIQVEELVAIENDLKDQSLAELNITQMRAMKRKGFSDSRLATLLQKTEKASTRAPTCSRGQTCL